MTEQNKPFSKIIHGKMEGTAMVYLKPFFQMKDWNWSDVNRLPLSLAIRSGNPVLASNAFVDVFFHYEDPWLLCIHINHNEKHTCMIFNDPL